MVSAHWRTTSPSRMPSVMLPLTPPAFIHAITCFLRDVFIHLHWVVFHYSFTSFSVLFFSFPMTFCPLFSPFLPCAAPISSFLSLLVVLLSFSLFNSLILSSFGDFLSLSLKHQFHFFIFFSCSPVFSFFFAAFIPSTVPFPCLSFSLFFSISFKPLFLCVFHSPFSSFSFFLPSFDFLSFFLPSNLLFLFSLSHSSLPFLLFSPVLKVTL